MLPTHLDSKILEIGGAPWSPVEVSRYNDQVVYMALFEGEYHWHDHPYDEFFYVYKGKIEIQLQEGNHMILNSGECAVVPKGVKHCPRSLEPSYVVMVEPADANLKGN